MSMVMSFFFFKASHHRQPLRLTASLPSHHPATRRLSCCVRPSQLSWFICCIEMFSFTSPSLLIDLPLLFFSVVPSTAHYPHTPFTSLTLYKIRNPGALVSCLPPRFPPHLFYTPCFIITFPYQYLLSYP